MARRADPAAHAAEIVREGDVGDAADQVADRHQTVRYIIAAVHAVGAVIAQHEHVSVRHPHLRQVGVVRVRWSRIHVGLLHRHAVDDGAAALEGDAVAFDRGDAPDPVLVGLLGMDVDHHVAAAWQAAAVVGGVGQEIFAALQGRRHAAADGIEIAELPGGLGVVTVEPEADRDQPSQRERAGINGPAVVAAPGYLGEVRRARARVDDDVEPQPQQQREADREHPEPRQHPHHREHQKRVRNHYEKK